MRRPTTFICLLEEMTFTLDDVACLLCIPIEGKMMDNEKKIFEETGVQLMTELLGVDETYVIDECHHWFGAFINIPFLKQLYEEHFNMKTQVKNIAEREEDREDERNI